MTPPRQADVSRIAALHHPVRRRIVEILAVRGAATVGSLAQRTQQQVGSISHHLKILARAGLVEEAPELARDKRERWWRQVAVTMSWSMADMGDSAADRIIAEDAEEQSLEHHVDKVRHWFEHRGDYDDGWLRAAYSSASWLRATAAEVEELGRRLDETVREFIAEIPDDEGSREHVFVFTHAVPSRP